MLLLLQDALPPCAGMGLCWGGQLSCRAQPLCCIQGRCLVVVGLRALVDLADCTHLCACGAWGMTPDVLELHLDCKPCQ